MATKRKEYKYNLSNLLTFANAARLANVRRQTISLRVKTGSLDCLVIDGHPFVFADQVKEVYGLSLPGADVS